MGYLLDAEWDNGSGLEELSTWGVRPLFQFLRIFDEEYGDDSKEDDFAIFLYYQMKNILLDMDETINRFLDDILEGRKAAKKLEEGMSPFTTKECCQLTKGLERLLGTYRVQTGLLENLDMATSTREQLLIMVMALPKNKQEVVKGLLEEILKPMLTQKVPEPAQNPEDPEKPGDTMEEYQAIMILKENEELLSKVAKAQKSGLDVEAYLDNFISADELGLGAQDRYPLVDSI